MGRKMQHSFGCGGRGRPGVELGTITPAGNGYLLLVASPGGSWGLLPPIGGVGRCWHSRLDPDPVATRRKLQARSPQPAARSPKLQYLFCVWLLYDSFAILETCAHAARSLLHSAPKRAAAANVCTQILSGFFLT